MTASVACCVCGGGVNGFSTTTETSSRTTSTTSSYCVDWRPASEDHWYVGSTSQDCGYLAYFCQDSIASVPSFGHTASEACCYCGGGTGYTSTQITLTNTTSSSTSFTSSTTGVTDTSSFSSSTTFTSSTSSTSTTTHSSTTGTTASTLTRCEDWVPLMVGLSESAWYDSTGPAFGCDFYEAHGLCGTGEDFENFDRTADEACCACGGGVNIASTTTGTYTTTTRCVDMVPAGAGGYWYDSRGTLYNCRFYAHADFCTSEGALYPNFGYTAQEVCCVCSGGTGKTATNTTSTGSSTSTAITITATITSTSSHTVTTSGSTTSMTVTSTTGSVTSSASATTSSRTSSTLSLSSSTSVTAVSSTSSRSNTSTSTSATTSSTSGTLTTLALCADYVPEDADKWYDSLGAEYDCKWYATDGGGDYCGEFGSVQSLNFNRTAREACCACGGGVRYTQTTTVTRTSTTECFDWQPSPQVEKANLAGP
ncbi:unnamed protein product [Prorocentrum cordatum]|uniref:Cellulase n=1 Tax=Prorocentrum cordatum TaxID=2364126 RepID=A0ABN9S9B7_9DINO|nr:unnamed protein product [Polarella glacialis]